MKSIFGLLFYLNFVQYVKVNYKEGKSYFIKIIYIKKNEIDTYNFINLLPYFKYFLKKSFDGHLFKNFAFCTSRKYKDKN